MVLLSFYLITEKHGKLNRRWLRTMEDYPSDWLQFKMLLEEVMALVHHEHSKTEATVSLERHLPGRFFMGFASYGQKKFHYKREYEAILELEYNPKMEVFKRVTVKKAQFSYNLRHLREDYWWIEKGIRWRGPPLIPRGMRDPLDPLSMIMEETTTRYADYSVRVRPNYAFTVGHRPSYLPGVQAGIYGRRRDLSYRRQRH